MPTHNGSYGLSYMRCLPGMVIMVPADENECRQMLYTGFMLDQPAAVRYPRGTGMGVEVQAEMTILPVGKAEVRRKGKGIAILAFGVMLEPALAAAEELNATVVNMRFVKPVDEITILEMAATHDLLVTFEENVIQGGAGNAVSEVLTAHGIVHPLLQYGLPDRLIQHGTREDMLKDAGLDKDGLLEFIRQHHRLSESDKKIRSL